MTRHAWMCRRFDAEHGSYRAACAPESETVRMNLSTGSKVRKLMHQDCAECRTKTVRRRIGRDGYAVSDEYSTQRAEGAGQNTSAPMMISTSDGDVDSIRHANASARERGADFLSFDPQPI
jgi:hypothetical protein